MNYKKIINLIILILVISNVYAQTKLVSNTPQLKNISNTTLTVSSGLTFDLAIDNETNENSTNENDDRSNDQTNNNQNIKQEVIQIKILDRERFSQSLNMKDSSLLSDETVTKLIRIESNNINKFQEIKLTTLRFVEEDIKKNTFVNEISNMNETFVKELSVTNKEDEESIKQQINDYVNQIENEIPIVIKIEETQIQDLFNKNLNLDTLIDQIW
ncbi:hypothetical protein HN789_06010 [archaeon]|jgi:hypothetical protein|nr:hypothetical protein [archaeon]MBT4022324.1 hypothetical protein [archaeon]MBT4273202.1 hypothetical protein [archaeon]MBT4461355.1 hypothetical protein [archaeon]MBT4858901.1 hypothetical protein [archaeon]